MAITGIKYLDCCTSGFFQGYSGVVLAVPCVAGMTWADLKDAIDEESNAADYGIDDWSGFQEALDSLFAKAKLVGHNAVDFFDHEEMRREEEKHGADNLETLYAYFGIEQDTE